MSEDFLSDVDNHNEEGYQNNQGGYNRNYGGGGGGYQNNFQRKPYGNYNNNGNNNWKNKGNFNKGGFKPRQSEEDVSDFKLYKPYVGTGNANPPLEIVTQIKRLANELESFGFTLRTGGTAGTEEAFEVSVKDMELHLPFNNYNNKQSSFAFINKKAYVIAKLFHPTYDTLPDKVTLFLAKNARLLLGKDLKSPALFLLCWSEDGCESSAAKTMKTGNVGHAIAIAAALHLPIFNLAKPDAERRLKEHLGIPYVKKEQIQEF